MASELPPKIDPRVFIIDPVHAPIMFFETVTNHGHANGIVNLSLAVVFNRANPNGGVGTDLSVVADLRCTVEAAKHLRSAIDAALLIAMPVEVSKEGAN